MNRMGFWCFEIVVLFFGFFFSFSFFVWVEKKIVVLVQSDPVRPHHDIHAQYCIPARVRLLEALHHVSR